VFCVIVVCKCSAKLSFRMMQNFVCISFCVNFWVHLASFHLSISMFLDLNAVLNCTWIDKVVRKGWKRGVHCLHTSMCDLMTWLVPYWTSFPCCYSWKVCCVLFVQPRCNESTLQNCTIEIMFSCLCRPCI
jgi:hypothetical protein